MSYTSTKLILKFHAVTSTITRKTIVEEANCVCVCGRGPPAQVGTEGSRPKKMCTGHPGATGGKAVQGAPERDLGRKSKP